MVAKQLNARQKEVLTWISAGCPDNDWEPSYYKASARMLEGHDLIKIKGSGRSWRATITERGKRVLAGKEPLVKRKKSAAHSAPSHTRPTKAAPDPKPVVPVTPLAVIEKWADELHARLEAAEFRILTGLPINRDEVEVDWEAAAKHLRQRLSEGVDSWRLDFSTRFAGGYRYGEPHDTLDVCLHEIVPWQTEPVEDIVEADSSPRFHPGVKEVMKYSTALSTGMKPRARRLLHSVFSEAEARGWAPGPVENRDLSRTEVGRRERQGESLMEYGFVAYGAEYRVSIFELTDRVERPPTKAELKRHQELLRWSANRRMERFYDHLYNGRLELHIGRLVSRDTKQGRRSVVTGIPQDFATIELGGVWRSYRVEMDRRRQAFWERKLELARPQADVVYRNRVLHGVLTERAGEWDAFRKVTQYLADMEAFAAEHDLDDSAATWLEWCRGHGQDNNPMTRLRMPTIATQHSWEREKLVEEIAKTISDEEVA